jgi:voltage-gated potassium channel Kch
VEFVRHFGNEIFFGDAARLDLLDSADIGHAAALVIAVDDVEASIRIAELVLGRYPNLRVLARARDRHHELRLKELGVHFTIRETLRSALALSESVLETVGHDPESARETAQRFLAFDEQTLARQSAVFRDPVAYRQSAREAAAELETLFAADSRSTRETS